MGHLSIGGNAERRACFARVAFNLCTRVNRVEADAEAEVLVKTIGGAEIKVAGHQIGLAAVAASGIAVVEFRCQTIV